MLANHNLIYPNLDSVMPELKLICNWFSYCSLRNNMTVKSFILDGEDCVKNLKTCSRF